MFQCEKCKISMVLDYKYTSAFYNDNVTVVLDDNGDIMYDCLPDKVVYVCRRCGIKEVVDFKTIVMGIKEIVCKVLLNTRLEAVYKAVNKGFVDEGNGVTFCGMCGGVIDESGYCYNDVIKQCPIRKFI